MARTLRRFALSVASTIFIVAALGLALWWTVLPGLAGRLALSQLQALGLPVRALTVEQIRFNSLRAGAISIGDDAALIGRLDIEMNLGRLLFQQRLDRVRIADAYVRANIDEFGVLTLPGIELGEGAGGSFSVPVLPVDRIEIADSRLLLGTPLGAVTAPLEATLVSNLDGSAALYGEIQATGDFAEVTILLDARITQDGSFDGGLVLREGRVTAEEVVATGVSGWVTVAGTLGGLSAFDGQLQVDHLARGDASLTDVAILAGGAGLPDWATIRATGPDGSLTAAIDIAASSWERDEGANLAADIDVTAFDLVPIAGLLGLPEGTTGRAQIVGQVSSSVALDAAAGELKVALRDATFPGIAEAADLAIEATVLTEGETVTIESDKNWIFSGRIEALGERLTARLGPIDGDRHRWSVAWADGALTVAGASSVALEGPGLRLSGHQRSRLDGGVTIDELELAGAVYTIPGLAVRVEQATLTGTPESAEISAALRLAGRAPGGVSLDDARIQLAGRLDVAGGGLTLVADDCILASARTLAVEGVLVGAFNACLRSVPGQPVVALAGDRVDIDVVTPPIPVVVALADGPRLDLVLPAMTIDATPATATVAATGGRLAIPGEQLTVDGLAGTFTVTPGADTLVAGDFRATSLRPPGNATGPLAVTARASWNAAGAIAFSGNARGSGGRLAASFDGEHDLKAGGGSARFRLSPVLLAADTPPGELLPALAGLGIDAAAGTVAAQGRYGWGGGAGTSATLTATDLSVTFGDITLIGVNGTLNAASLDPLTMRPGQRLAIDGLDVGVLLENGVVEFGLSRGDQLDVSRLDFNWASGIVAAEPFVTRFGDDDRRIAVTARDIDLTTLVAQLEIGGLAVIGRVSGRVPVRQSAGEIYIDNGLLQSNAPGAIQYTPEEDIGAGDESVTLVMDALKNFQYSSLTMTLNGQIGADLEVGFAIDGANPDLYDGYPIALNVSLTGALDQILRRSLETTGYADRLQELFMNRALGQ